jgi:alkanesulfonate monooxygenase SsuD/methylene tetrahydromethanopterin reductase-like flavin-dependent oxidoreductase (luciferase family)
MALHVPDAVELGVAIAPAAESPGRTIRLGVLAEAAGLDMIGMQDHPYLARFLDTWSALCYLGARTKSVRLLPDVANLPLRQPAVLAKAAATLDLLTGGRVELGLGAGAFWTDIASMGGPARSKAEAVAATAEAIEVIRACWRGREVTVGGSHYRLDGLRPGPVPAHPIGIWVGAFGRRMAELTGRLADGWLPSFPPLREEDVPDRQATIDQAARAHGREPGSVRRLANVGDLDGPVSSWADKLARRAEKLRFDGFLVATDEEAVIRRLGEQVAPRLRRLTAGLPAAQGVTPPR